jgi:hypothetical protein
MAVFLPVGSLLCNRRKDTIKLRKLDIFEEISTVFSIQNFLNCLSTIVLQKAESATADPRAIEINTFADLTISKAAKMMASCGRPFINLSEVLAIILTFASLHVLYIIRNEISVSIGTVQMISDASLWCYSRNANTYPTPPRSVQEKEND